jgi:acetyl esterase/lipase
LPPLLIQVGAEEVLYADANRLNAAAQAGGVEATFGAERGATQRIAGFLDHHLRRRAAAAHDRRGREVRAD